MKKNMGNIDRVIRTLIAYFLNKEIQELETEAGATS